MRNNFFYTVKKFEQRMILILPIIAVIQENHVSLFQNKGIIGFAHGKFVAS